MSPADLANTWVHLGLRGTAVPQPEFDGDMNWYKEYGERNGSDGAEGRLVSMHTFTESWDSWEAHMDGSELVVCTSGSIILIQEIDGEHVRITLTSGQFAINEPGVWHTADVFDGPTTGLFVTSGGTTQHRPR